MFVVIAKDIFCFIVGAFARSDDRKSKKRLLRGTIVCMFAEIKSNGTKNITGKKNKFTHFDAEQDICLSKKDCMLV